MSLPDYLLEPEDETVCAACGDEPVCMWRSRTLCSSCWHAQADEDADAYYEALQRQRERSGYAD